MSESPESPKVEHSMGFDRPVALKVLIAFLRAGRILDHTSSLLLIGTFLLTYQSASVFAVLGIAAALTFAFAEKYYAWRIALDADLFSVLCEYPQEASLFDASLATILGRQVERAPRSMESRWKGAMQLLYRQAACFALQAASVLALAVGIGIR
jgi:hypothetical protein